MIERNMETCFSSSSSFEQNSPPEPPENSVDNLVANSASDNPPSPDPSSSDVSTHDALPFTYTGDVMPSADGWTVINYPAYEPIGARVENGLLHFTDYHTYLESAIHYKREWEVVSGYLNVVEFDVRVVSAPYEYGIYIGSSDGEYHMTYSLCSDRIVSHYYGVPDPTLTGEIYHFDTTKQFNTYRAVIENGIAKLYINRKLTLEQPAGIGIYNVKGIEFGAGSGPATGEAYFNEIRAYRVPIALSSSVDPIEPYWQVAAPFTITATATDNPSGVENVELWYRYSLDNWTDNVAWKKRGWRLYGVDTNGLDGWSWSFDPPYGYGYYEFYSIAVDRAGNREEPPGEADAGCRVAKDVRRVAVIFAKRTMWKISDPSKR